MLRGRSSRRRPGSRLETAVRWASPRDVRDLCLLYRVPTDERDRLMALAAQALETTWYQDAAIRSVYETFIGLEEAASDIAIFHSLVLPGLVQTEAYARALVAGIRPPGVLPVAETEEIIRVRMRRRRLLEAVARRASMRYWTRWRCVVRSVGQT